MIPVLISEGAPISLIFKILGIKIFIGIFVGIIIDFFSRGMIKGEKVNNNAQNEITEICDHEHCHCEQGIFKSSLKHTINIFAFILLISLVLNITILFIGEDSIANLVSSNLVWGPIISGLIGLIPNCASSVIITQLYLSDVLSAATMLTGLLVGSGVGMLVLFKVNKNLKENIRILCSMYVIGVISGIILEMVGLTF